MEHVRRPSEITDIMSDIGTNYLYYAINEIKIVLQSKTISPEVKSKLKKIKARIEKMENLSDKIYVWYFKGL